MNKLTEFAANTEHLRRPCAQAWYKEKAENTSVVRLMNFLSSGSGPDMSNVPQ